MTDVISWTDALAKIQDGQYHRATAAVLELFEFRQLPEHLRTVSRDFAFLAVKVAERHGWAGDPEATVALLACAHGGAHSAVFRLQQDADS